MRLAPYSKCDESGGDGRNGGVERRGGGGGAGGDGGRGEVEGEAVVATTGMAIEACAAAAAGDAVLVAAADGTAGVRASRGQPLRRAVPGAVDRGCALLRENLAFAQSAAARLDTFRAAALEARSTKNRSRAPIKGDVRAFVQTEKTN